MWMQESACGCKEMRVCMNFFTKIPSRGESAPLENVNIQGEYFLRRGYRWGKAGSYCNKCGCCQANQADQPRTPSDRSENVTNVQVVDPEPLAAHADGPAPEHRKLGRCSREDSPRGLAAAGTRQASGTHAAVTCGANVHSLVGPPGSPRRFAQPGYCTNVPTYPKARIEPAAVVARC
jgi:hypothetical protein